MSCASFLETTRRDAAYFEEFARQQAIMPWYKDGLLQVSVVHNRLSLATNQRLESQPPSRADDLISVWFHGEISLKGPKLFRPTEEQCLDLEQIAPRIPIADYAQPFPVTIIDLPETYREKRACVAVNSLHVGRHTPEFVLVGFPACDVPTVWVQLGFSSCTVRTVSTLQTDATLETWIVREYGEDSYVSLNAPTPEERVVLAGLLRLAVNAMLLLTEYGCKRLGPVNESHYRRLQRHVEVARKRKERITKAERELRLAPQLYAFEQNIVLHDEARSDAERPEESDESHRRPHWRRGHWKTHAHGVGKSLRKRILIKPVMVNRHLLIEEGQQSLTTYRVK